MEIKANLNKPYVKLDKEKCCLTFKGKSYPEHPRDFYEPILNEVINCSNEIEGIDITVNLMLEIMNSISAKYVFKILKEIESNCRKLNINWYFEYDDEDMEDEGYLFKDSFKTTNFNLISVKDLNDI
jgi:hypothetical protein